MRINELEMIEPIERTISNNWLISIRLLVEDSNALFSSRNEIINLAHEKKIFLRPAWKLLNELPMYRKNPSQNTIIAREEVERIINLPSSPQILNNE